MRGLDAGHVRVEEPVEQGELERSLRPGGRWKLADGRSFRHRT